MRELFRDFVEQSWIMKAIVLWGWLCVLVMLTSLYDNLGILMAG